VGDSINLFVFSADAGMRAFLQGNEKALMLETGSASCSVVDDEKKLVGVRRAEADAGGAGRVVAKF